MEACGHGHDHKVISEDGSSPVPSVPFLFPLLHPFPVSSPLEVASQIQIRNLGERVNFPQREKCDKI